MVEPKRSIPNLILEEIGKAPRQIWTPSDFAVIGSRDAVDKALQRLTRAGHLRRIDRGLYDAPKYNSLTGKETVPDYRKVIEAVARRDQVRMVVDGMTAANTLGMTNAVPAKIEVLVDARLKPIQIGAQKIVFKHSAPSRLFWAGRPGMYLVQALHWLHDVMSSENEHERVLTRVRQILRDENQNGELIADLKNGFSAMPIWMQNILRKPITEADEVMG